MSMTKLELMKMNLRHLRLLDSMPPKNDFVPNPEVVTFVEDWIAELEAAEKQAQPSKTVVDELLELSDRFACLYGRVDNLEGFNAEANAKIEKLGKRLDRCVANLVDQLSHLLTDQETADAKIERLVRRDDEVRAWCKKHDHCMVRGAIATGAARDTAKL